MNPKLCSCGHLCYCFDREGGCCVCHLKFEEKP